MGIPHPSGTPVASNTALAAAEQESLPEFDHAWTPVRIGSGPPVAGVVGTALAPDAQGVNSSPLGVAVGAVAV